MRNKLALSYSEGDNLITCGAGVCTRNLITQNTNCITRLNFGGGGGGFYYV